MDKVTIRIPEEQSEKVKRLVDAGEFPSESEVYRAGAREELAKYDFSGDVPDRKPRPDDED